MSAAGIDRRSRWIAGALWAVVLCGGVACATATGSQSAGGLDVAVLSDVHVEQQGDATVVVLAGVRDSLYVAQEEFENDRLVMELSHVRPAEGAPQSVAMVEGVVEEVAVAEMIDGAGVPYTRVEIALGSPVAYEVRKEGSGLSVELIASDEAASWDAPTLDMPDMAGLGDEGFSAPGTPLTSLDVAEETDSWDTAGSLDTESWDAAPSLDESGSWDAPADAGAWDTQPDASAWDAPADEPAWDAPAAMEPEEALVAPAPVAAPDARELRAVEVHSDGSGTTVHLVADGRIAGAESFELADPARLVIDVPGVGSVASPRVEGSGAHVGSVRVGQHPDKVRVVVDGAADGSLEGWAATPVADGLVVTWGTASPPAEAAWSAPAAADEDWSVEATPGAVVAPPDAGTQVHDVAFHSGAGSSRVVIVTAGPASYQLFEPDGETVVVSMPDAALMPGADSRIAPDPGGPVALVMAFQQPEVERPEVRVVITRAPELTPMVTREGANLVVSFDSDDGTAATPPVLGADAGSTAAAKALASATDPSLPAAPAVTGDGLDILAEGGMVAGKQYVGRRMSLDFKDVELDDVLRLIGDVSDLNIIAGDDVKGTVTLRLVDVPWDQALDVILLTHGLGFEKVGNVLRIAPQALLQKESEARLQERRAKEKLEDLLVKFQPVNYAAVKNVAKMVQRLLSARGTVNTDERTNTVIIKDIPSVIDESVALIKAIDTPTPQVLIEAKVVEANLDFTRALGTVWGVGVQEFNDAFDTSSGTSQIRGSPDFRLHPDPRLVGEGLSLNNLAVFNPIPAPTALLNLGAFILDQQFNVELEIQAQESAGEAKVISSPRVVTLDNTEAQIQQGFSIPFQTFENGDAQLEFIDAVLELKVKPHITADKSIIMQLNVSRNAPDDSVATGLAGAPAIAKNETKTMTLVRDGQTLVIGGIYTITKFKNQSRVPFLHSIPVLGWLFKNDEVRDTRQELLIFVTPRIVEMPQLGS